MAQGAQHGSHALGRESLHLSKRMERKPEVEAVARRLCTQALGCIFSTTGKQTQSAPRKNTAKLRA